MAKLASINYGEALLLVGREGKKQRALLNEVIVLKQILADNPDLYLLLTNPNISVEEKTDVLTKVFKDKVDADIYAFLCLLVSKNRYTEIDDILEFYISEAKEELRIGTAYVSTAFELDAATKAKILDKLMATTDYETIEVVYEVDPKLIGGMIIRIRDRIINNTVSNKLEQMERSLHKVIV